MKEIVLNDNNLDKKDIELEVVRVKGLILNSKGKILLAHNNNTFQFPGGHKEDDESLDECIIREIKEETGIDLEVVEEPFLCITTYDDNYFNTGKKVLNKIYYYRFFTDSVPDFKNTHYDELELMTDFNLFYINFDSLDNFLKKSELSGKINEKIAREMSLVILEYNRIYGGN